VAYRPVTQRRGIDASVSRQRILDATEALVLDGGFAQATVSELADRAGVSRATVFSQFGSKLGVLEALAVRCAGGPTMRAIREAVALDDAERIVPALIDATCDHWERQGHILLTLKAVTELEPGAIALIDEQREDQRTSIETVVRTLRRGGRGGDLPATQLVAALHMATSVESFMELRRNAGLSLKATKAVLQRTAAGLLDRQT
jgi:AcrR family transcriptional regulator